MYKLISIKIVKDNQLELKIRDNNGNIHSLLYDFDKGIISNNIPYGLKRFVNAVIEIINFTTLRDFIISQHKNIIDFINCKTIRLLSTLP